MEGGSRHFLILLLAPRVALGTPLFLPGPPWWLEACGWVAESPCWLV